MSAATGCDRFATCNLERRVSSFLLDSDVAKAETISEELGDQHAGGGAGVFDFAQSYSVQG
jgi:hypothetical protein